MQRALRNNLTLIGIVAILGAAALADQVRERLAAPRPLLALDPKSVHEIVLECPDCPRRRLEKIGGRWEMAEPYALPADPARIEGLLEIPKSIVQHHYSATALEPAKIGLVPPFATLTLGPRKLEFGTTETLRNERYVRTGGGIELVQDRYSHMLRIAPEGLLEPHPFAGLPRIVAARLDGRALGDAARERLAALRAQRVAPAPASVRGRALEVELGDGRTLGFELVRYGEEWQLVRRVPLLAYTLDSTDVDAVLATDAKD